MTDKLISAVVGNVVGGVVVACVSHVLNKEEAKMKAKAKAEEQKRINLKANPANTTPAANDTMMTMDEFSKALMDIWTKL